MFLNVYPVEPSNKMKKKYINISRTHKYQTLSTD